MRSATILLVLLADTSVTPTAPAAGDGPTPLMHYPMVEGEGERLHNAAAEACEGLITAAGWALSSRRAALVLDGRRTCVTVEGSEELAFKHSFSVDLWMWPEQPVTRGMLGLATKHGMFRLLVAPDRDTMKFLVELTSGAGRERLYETFAVEARLRQWYHVALAYAHDTQTTRVYLDGNVVLDKQQDIGRLAHPASALRLGLGVVPAQRRYFKGMLAGARLWGHALTQTEVRNMVDRERPNLEGTYREPGALMPRLPAADPIAVGNRKQLFIDDRFIESSKHVQLTMNPPRKLGPVLRATEPWEEAYLGFLAAVVDHDDVIRMWYRAQAAEGTKTKGGVLCYATSTDGFHWDKPRLGLHEFGGSTDNNILMRGIAAGTVFLDPVAPPHQRFKFPHQLYWPDPEKGGMYVHWSADGIHWQGGQTRVLPLVPDTANQVHYDPRLGKYVAYIRCWDPLRKIMRIEMDDVLEPWPITPLAEPNYLWGKDKVATPSREAPVVFGYDEQDPVPSDHYHAAAVQYPWADDAYVMFPSAYLHFPPPPVGKFPNCGPLDIQMAVSRDGINWDRISRRPYVELGLDGEIDSKSLYMAAGIVRRGDQILQFYGGMDYLHGDTVNRRAGAMCAVSQRLDGFVSADAAYTGGALMTPPMLFEGGRLELNVNTSAMGAVRVAILDAEGEVLDGCSDADCDPIHGNYIRRVVTWQGNSDLSKLANRAIRLHFVMRSTKLYAFQFTDAVNE